MKANVKDNENDCLIFDVDNTKSYKIKPLILFDCPYFTSYLPVPLGPLSISVLMQNMIGFDSKKIAASKRTE